MCNELFNNIIKIKICSDECNYLEDNFKRCLVEKQLKDNVPKMKCKPEQVIKNFYL